MKIKEIRDRSDDELVLRKRELRQESFHLRLQQQSGQLEKPSQLREIRREVARIETTLSQRHLGKDETPATATAAPTKTKKQAAAKKSTKAAKAKKS
jgi:large subunit ribosomal protein L29